MQALITPHPTRNISVNIERDSKFLDFADDLEELGKSGQWSIVEHNTEFFRHAFVVADCWNNYQFRNGEVVFQSRDGKRTWKLTFRKIAVLDQFDCDYDLLLREIDHHKGRTVERTVFFFTVPASFLLGG